MPLLVDEQCGRSGVGSLAELLSNEPLRDDSSASESELPVEQTVETREIVRQAVIVRTDASRSQRMVHQEDGSCAWEGAQRGVLPSEHPPPCCLWWAYHLRPPHFCSSFPPDSRLWSRCFPCVLHHSVVYCLCVAGTGNTRRTRCVPCLRMQTLRALLATWVIRAHMFHLAATRGPQHTPNRLIRHTVITRDVTEWFSLLGPLEHSRPCRGRDLPARIRDGVRVTRHRQKPRMVKGRGERIIAG